MYIFVTTAQRINNGTYRYDRLHRVPILIILMCQFSFHSVKSMKQLHGTNNLALWRLCDRDRKLSDRRIIINIIY